MIYTITLNPSLDYYMQVSQSPLVEVNRAIDSYTCVGGKGINVARVLSELGNEVIALGFLGGFNGKRIQDTLDNLKVLNAFIWLENEETRMNVKVVGQDEIQINALGPYVKEVDQNQLLEDLKKRLKTGDYVILSGSAPKGCNAFLYQSIAEITASSQCILVVDAQEEYLLKTLKYRPFLIKPNLEELEMLFEVKIDTVESVIEYGKQLQAYGAQNVLISMGEKGGIFLGEQGEFYKRQVNVSVVEHTVGAGDSMIAGFVSKFAQSKNLYEAFLMGLAAASASVSSKELPTKENIIMYYESLQ